MENKVNYEQKAVLYAEKYGIVSYKVEGNEMIYFEEATESVEQIAVYKAVVNLDTMRELRNLVQ